MPTPTNLNDYLVSVIYRSVYNSDRLVRALKVGVHDLRDVTNLLVICMWYQEFLEFIMENDGVFVEDEIRALTAHLDDILWTNSSTVNLTT